MTQEDKKLLLKDICARLLYGIKVLADIDEVFDGGCIGIVSKIELYTGNKFPDLKGQYLLYQENSLTPLTIDEVRPYLRPMLSMTEKERREWMGITHAQEWLIIGNLDKAIDWLNAHHFDYRGLIDKGLALEAPEGMYSND